MKKFVSILLVFVLLALNFQVAFSAENLEVSFDIYEESTEKTVVLNSSIATSDYDLYVAAYKGKKLQALQKIDMVLKKNYNSIDTGLDWDDLDKDAVRIFVWEEGMKIHSEKYEYDVLRPATSSLSTFIVTKKTEVSYNGGTAYLLYGVHNGESTRITVYNEKGYDGQHPESLAADDVILIAEPDGDGVVSYIEKLETTKYEGVVESTPYSESAKAGMYDPSASLRFALSDSFYWDNQNGQPVKVTHNPGLIQCGQVDVNEFLGKNVAAYIGEDSATGKLTAYAVMENDTKNSVIKINATQLVKDYEKYWDVSDVIGYREAGSTKILDISLEATTTVYVNYCEETGVDTTKELVYNLLLGGTVEFVSNDADEAYEVILVTAYNDESVVEKIEQFNGKYYFTLYVGDMPRIIDPNDEDVLTIVYKDGKSATVADIAVNDTVSYVKVAKNLEIYYVSSATVEGTVESYDSENNIVTINGTDYELSVVNGCYTAKLKGETGIFFLNIDGQISHNETKATDSANYALILGAYESSGIDRATYLQAVLADGTVAEYRIGDKAKIYDAYREIIEENTTNDKRAVYNYFTAMMTEEYDSQGIYRATVADVLAEDELVAKVTISSGKITEVRYFEGYTRIVDDYTKKYDGEAMSIGNINLGENTVVFSVKQTEADDYVEANDIVIGTPDSIFTDYKPINGVVKVYDESNQGIYRVAVGFGIGKTIDAASDLFIVTGKTTTSIDGNDAYSLRGMQAGEEKTVTVYNKDDEYITDPADVTVGDVLLLKDANEDGITSDIQMLVDYDREDGLFRVYASNTALADDEILAGMGEVILSENNKFAIDDYIMAELRGAFDEDEVNIAAGTALSYRSSARYTLVDFTRNLRNPEVSLEPGNRWLFDTEMYESVAYVRYVGGVMKEVVVYRMAELE